LTVADGRRFCGTIVDHDVGRSLSRAWVFDCAGRPLGAFNNRREAVAAIAAREEFEARRAAS
jgi:hypothetical protein